MRIDVLGVGFDAVSIDEAVERALALIEQGGSSWVVTPNPEIVWQCRTNEELRRAVENAALVLPDGIGIIYGARILSRPPIKKLPGIDFALALIGRLAEQGKSVYLLGGRPKVAEGAAQFLSEKFPGIRIAGTQDGYFKDSQAVVELINSAKPDFLMCCLGAPKQELWMADNAGRLNVPLMAGLGGSLDVFAGTAERAPKAWQKLNLEWLYRLIREPWRIKRMIKLPLFIFAVIGQKIKGG